MSEEPILKVPSQGQSDTDMERRIAWQRTLEMAGRIKRNPGITWEQVEGAITGQTGYVSTLLRQVYDDEHRVIASYYEGELQDAEDDGFVLGDGDK